MWTFFGALFVIGYFLFVGLPKFLKEDKVNTASHGDHLAWNMEYSLAYHIFWEEVVPEVYAAWNKLVPKMFRPGDKVKVNVELYNQWKNFVPPQDWKRSNSSSGPWRWQPFQFYHFGKYKDHQEFTPQKDEIFTLAAKQYPGMASAPYMLLQLYDLSGELVGNVEPLVGWLELVQSTLKDNDEAYKIGIYHHQFDLLGKNLYEGRTPVEEAHFRARSYMLQKGWVLPCNVSIRDPKTGQYNPLAAEQQKDPYLKAHTQLQLDRVSQYNSTLLYKNLNAGIGRKAFYQEWKIQAPADNDYYRSHFKYSDGSEGDLRDNAIYASCATSREKEPWLYCNLLPEIPHPDYPLPKDRPKQKATR